MRICHIGRLNLAMQYSGISFSIYKSLLTTSQIHYPLRTEKHYLYHLFDALEANVQRASFISSKLEGDGISLEDVERYVLTMD